MRGEGEERRGEVERRGRREERKGEVERRGEKRRGRVRERKQPG